MKKTFFALASAGLAFFLFTSAAGAFISSSTDFYLRGEMEYLNGSSTSSSFRVLNSAAQGANGSSTSASFGILSGPLYTFFGSLKPLYEQIHFHWRNDDGSEVAATSATGGNQDTGLSGFTIGTIKRLRYEVSNEGGTRLGYSGAQFRLEYAQASPSCAAASYSQVTTTGAFAMASSTANLTEGADTTDISSSGNGALANANHFFLAPNGGQRKISSQTGALSLDSQSFVELEYAITPTASAVTTTPYCFRLSDAGATSTFSYATYATTTVASASANAAPNVSGITVNNGNPITLLASTTKSIDIGFVVTDTNGCSDVFTGGGVSTTLFRTGVGSGCAANNQNCYVTTAQTNNCSAGTSANATATIPLWYLAQATDASSSFSGQTWQAKVFARDAAGASGSSTSAGVVLNTLLAVNLATTTINYGVLQAGQDTGSVNQTVGLINVGNSSSTAQVSGTSLVFGTNFIATSSEHYATSPFTYNTGDQLLSAVLTTIGGFSLTAPTSTTAFPVQKNTYWGVAAPGGNPPGSYSGTVTLVGVWSP